jgi:hypothetical protein
MAAGQQQQQIGKRRAAGDQARQADGQRVRLQVIDRNEWQAVRQRQAFRKAAADNQSADQPGTTAGGDAAEVGH